MDLRQLFVSQYSVTVGSIYSLRCLGVSTQHSSSHKMSILFVLIFFLAFDLIQCGPKCSLNKVDRCAADVFVFGHSNITIPSTMEEVEQHCKARFQGLRCVQHYVRDCLSLFPKQVVSLLLRGASNNAKQQCKLDREEFLERSKCYKRNRDGLGRCMKRLVRQLGEAEKLPNKVPLTCCMLREYRDCSLKVVEKDSSCSQKDAKYFSSLLEGNAADVFDLVCRNKKVEIPNQKDRTCVEIDEKEIRKSKRPLSLLPSYIRIFTE